jgi:hypothetical protein
VTGFSASPKLIKGGLVLVDAETARVLRIISLQYNADTLTRKLQTQEAGGESGNRVEPTRFKGPAIETISFEAEIDATDQLEFPDQHPSAPEFGIQPQLALLESLVPSYSTRRRKATLARIGFNAGSKASSVIGCCTRSSWFFGKPGLQEVMIERHSCPRPVRGRRAIRECRV